MFLAEYHAEARESFESGAFTSRPTQGPVLEYKKLTNAIYKYAIHFICKNEQIMRADSITK